VKKEALMKKILIAIFLIILLLVPAVAFANGPAPDPDRCEIAVKNYQKIEKIRFYGTVDNEEYNCFYEIEISSEKGELTKDPEKQEKIFSFEKVPAIINFYIDVYYKDGSVLTTGTVAAADYGTYLYSTETGVLRSGTIESRPMNAVSYIMAMFFLPVLVGITLLFEVIVAALFNIDPKKYVAIINLITNPAMNVLLLVLMQHFVVDYTVMLIIAEVCAGVIEFLFYKRKYPEYTSKRLLLFTICANAASLLFGRLLTMWLW